MINCPRKDTRYVSFRESLMLEVDPAHATPPLAAFCFMTGFIDALCFSAIFVWCGFQTGNFAQLALAIARLFEGSPTHRDTTFHKADQQALCSLLSFIAGSLIGRAGDRIGSTKRIWLITGSFLCTLLTMAAAIAFWKAGQPSIASERAVPAWSNTLTFVGIGLISASLGLQGILAKRLNTQFGTTIVLTTIWVELFCDPRLFSFKERVVSRDHRVVAALCLFLGAFTSRALLYQLGTAGALGVAVGFRLLITLSWAFVRTKSC
jgi:uncharacterized membrane protein YoaK (UPF0700 family)